MFNCQKSEGAAGRFRTLARPRSPRIGLSRALLDLETGKSAASPGAVKPVPTHVRPVLRVLVLTFSLGQGCDEKSEEPAVGTEEPTAMRTRVGPYAFTQGILYRIEEGSEIPMVAVPGSGPARDTLPLEVSSAPALGPARFRRLAVSPDTEWVAWEVGGPGAWVGVVGPEERTTRVLGSWSKALPDTLLWAPAGGYLAVSLRHPDGRRSVEVFDVTAGKPLVLPWKGDCEGENRCDVTAARWVGGTLLDVEIRPGPDEPSVPFEINVSGLAPLDAVEEEPEDA